jgi:hypothetical protein
MRFYGGGPVGVGNAGVFNNATMSANINPLLDPKFKIQGGEPWNNTPLLPGRDTERYEQQQQFSIPPQLPSASAGNMEDTLARALGKSTVQPWQQILLNAPGSMTDVPQWERQRTDTIKGPYDPGNYTQNNKANPLRNYGWPLGMPQGLDSGIRPYFERYQGPGLQGELGTGAI